MGHGVWLSHYYHFFLAAKQVLGFPTESMVHQ